MGSELSVRVKNAAAAVATPAASSRTIIAAATKHLAPACLLHSPRWQPSPPTQLWRLVWKLRGKGVAMRRMQSSGHYGNPAHVGPTILEEESADKLPLSPPIASPRFPCLAASRVAVRLAGSALASRAGLLSASP